MLPSDRLIIKSHGDTEIARLPGVVVMPDGTKPMPLGSGNITSMLSSGGTAIIYEIWNPELEVTRAVKLLHPDHSAESEDRFQTEIKISAKLHHPNIVEIYSVGKWNNLPFIEMERIQGQTLEDLIKERGALPVNVCTAIGIMVGRALNYSHNQKYVIRGKEYHGIIHRDLKPSNIMISNDGTVKLMDFGIAKPLNASSRTMEGVVMGTMQYLSPEQLNQGEVDVRSDIYSLGTVLYEALTGAKAFPEQNLARLVTDTLASNYVPLDAYTIKIPGKLRKLIHRCMLHDKDKRMQNALAFLRALGAIHKQIADASPEQITRAFMAPGAYSGKKTTVLARRQGYNPLPLVAWTVTAAIAALAIAFLVISRDYIHTRIVKWYALIRTPESPPAVSSPATQAPAATAANAEKRKADEVVAALSAPQSAAASTEPVNHQKPIPQSRARMTPASAAENAAPPPSPALALRDNLMREYHTGDLLSILAGETEAGRFQNGLMLLPAMPKSLGDQTGALLYQMRCYKGLNDRKGLLDFLATHTVNDGEFYLERARVALRQQDFEKTAALIERAYTLPAALMDQTMFRRELLFLDAQCKSGRFDAAPIPDNKKAAMEAWFNVKTMFKATPGHEYFKMADAEIRRIDQTQ